MLNVEVEIVEVEFELTATTSVTWSTCTTT